MKHDSGGPTIPARRPAPVLDVLIALFRGRFVLHGFRDLRVPAADAARLLASRKGVFLIKTRFEVERADRSQDYVVTCPV